MRQEMERIKAEIDREDRLAEAAVMGWLVAAAGWAMAGVLAYALLR